MYQRRMGWQKGYSRSEDDDGGGGDDSDGRGGHRSITSASGSGELKLGYDPPPVRRPGSGPYSNPLAVPPPLSRFGGGPSSAQSFISIGKRRAKDDDDYFNDDDEDSAATHENVNYDSQKTVDHPAQQSDSDEEDPLDAFMEGISKEVNKLQGTEKSARTGGSAVGAAAAKPADKGVRTDLEGEDEIESYMRFMAENPDVGVDPDDLNDHCEYDAEGNIIFTDNKKVIEPLPAFDHATVEYQPFERNFYVEHKDISSLTCKALTELRKKLGIRVSGVCAARPVCSFGHFGFDEQLLNVIRKQGYTEPTPIQAQGVPIALQGRDLIGIAKTGSGKTAAYLWPLLVHIMDQAPLAPGDGPIGLVCAPTRELAQQIYVEARRFGKAYGVTVVCAYGGGSMWEQQKACEAGCEVLVCTPGRLIDLVKRKSTNMRRVTFLVFDEADRMFNLGFEPQVRSIAAHVRPDRQTLLFSATFKARVERLARDVLVDPVRVIQGELGEANAAVQQEVTLFEREEAKWPWLAERVVSFTALGQLLVFVTRKSGAEEVAARLRAADHACVLIHGDMHQSARNDVISAFKRGEARVLVATDVAARGLDIAAVRTVVNFDVARDIDTHTHRVGRTGRAGLTGTAHTLLTPKDRDFSAHLVRNLESVNQVVPPALLELASQNAWFVNSRFKAGGGRRPAGGAIGGAGFGYRERPPAPPPLAGGGPGTVGPMGARTDRVTTMRTAFRSQYDRMFVSAGVEGGPFKRAPPQLDDVPLDVMGPPAQPPPLSSGGADPAAAAGQVRKSGKRSRWN